MSNCTTYFPDSGPPLAELIANSDWIVVEADNGGLPLFACRVAGFQVSDGPLCQLAADLEELIWRMPGLAQEPIPGPDTFIYFFTTEDRSENPRDILVSWNEGITSSGVWMNKEFYEREDLKDADIPAQVAAILAGKATRLRLP